MNTIQQIIEAEKIQAKFELDLVDEEISNFLKALPSNSVASEYPIRLQTAKSLKELVPLLKIFIELIELIKKGEENNVTKKSEPS